MTTPLANRGNTSGSSSQAGPTQTSLRTNPYTREAWPHPERAESATLPRQLLASGGLSLWLETASNGAIVPLRGHWTIPGPGGQLLAVEMTGVLNTLTRGFCIESVLPTLGSESVQVDRPVAHSRAEAITIAERFDLTRREAEVVRLLARGEPNVAIARVLGISQHTARHHTENVMIKLGVHTRAQVGAVLHGELGLKAGRSNRQSRKTPDACSEW